MHPKRRSATLPGLVWGTWENPTMQSKRDELVPVAEVVSELDGPVAAIRAASPQALHHFTRFDQVNQLVSASEADPDLGFMARTMALCSLPRSNPGNQLQYKRTNGPFTLGMIAGLGNKLPYGNLPRLLLVWVCTEAVRTQSRELILGSSLSGFMREIGLDSSSGAGRRRLRTQMDRLFHAQVEMIYEDQLGKQSVASRVADRSRLWWSNSQPDQQTLWNSTIRLGEDLFNEIIRCPVPLDMNTLKAMSRSPLGLDLYLWAVYRTFSLTRPLRLSWRALYRQFGVDPSRASDKLVVNDFRKDCLRELKKIKLAWPDLNYYTPKGVLQLYPSKPAIAPR